MLQFRETIKERLILVTIHRQKSNAVHKTWRIEDGLLFASLFQGHGEIPLPDHLKSKPVQNRWMAYTWAQELAGNYCLYPIKSLWKNIPQSSSTHSKHKYQHKHKHQQKQKQKQNKNHFDGDDDVDDSDELCFDAIVDLKDREEKEEEEEEEKEKDVDQDKNENENENETETIDKEELLANQLCYEPISTSISKKKKKEKKNRRNRKG